MDIRIITDDFTSATDGLVAFAQRGARAGVLFAETDEADDADGADEAALQAASVDTDSRHCSPELAAQRVAVWARRWRQARCLVKQFDSTLRGPLAAECQAALRASGRQRLLVLPAFPGAGRITRGGEVWVDGVPVHQTAFAQDPLCPVRGSALRPLFAAVGIELALASDLAAARRLFGAGATAVALDVATEGQLLDAAAAFAGDEQLLWAGSTGIVRALAEVLVLPAAAAPPSARPCRRPMLLLGSRNPRSRQQAEALLAAYPGVCVLRTPEQMTDATTAAHQLAEIGAQQLRSGACDGVLATGGETAKALAEALGAEHLSMLREVEPGVPLCLLHFGTVALPFITKAGGFGDAQTLQRCIHTLMTMEPRA